MTGDNLLDDGVELCEFPRNAGNIGEGELHLARCVGFRYLNIHAAAAEVVGDGVLGEAAVTEGVSALG